MIRQFAAAWLALGVALLPLPTLAAPAAESSDVRQAREEIEREMQKVAGQTPPGRVKVLWTGFDHEGVKADEADFELDDDALPTPATENLPQPAAKPLQDGHLPDGVHKLTVSLVISHSNITLLRGYRIDRFKVAAQVPFHSAKGLEVTVEVGLHVDTTQTEPKKMLTLKTSVKNTMLEAIDDSMPPSLIPVHPPIVDAGSVAPAPPLVVMADADHPSESADAGAEKPVAEASKRPAITKPRSAPGEKLVPDAGPSEASFDAGAAMALSAPAPIAVAALPPPPPRAPVIAPPPPPPAPPPEPESGKRTAAFVGALVLAGLAFALGRSQRKS